MIFIGLTCFRRKRKEKSNDPKANKGLRQFSLRLCRKVEAKGVTTYNEVADELVTEIKSEQPAESEKVSAKKVGNINYISVSI